MRKRAHAFALAALCGSGPTAAWADGTASPAGSSSTGTSSATVTMTPMADQGAAGTAPAASGAPAGSSSAAAPTAPAPGSEATGMTWSTRKHKGGHTGAAHRSHAAADAAPGPEGEGKVVPGFETLGDGSTRVFVQLPKEVKYGEVAARRGGATVTYVLKDVRVDKRNNFNPLVTVHFNTPVTSARLVPHGKDLWLVVALRAKVQPTAALQPAKDGGSVFQLDFPKGDYLPSAPASGGDDGAGAPAPADRSGRP